MKFEASPIEVARATHWGRYHGSESKHTERRDLEWCFVGSAVGTSVRVRCLSCKQHLDVSDYDSW